MFGYVTICEPELKVKELRKYKAYYCGLCRTLQEEYGAAGQMTLTYDMTFLIVLLTSLYECGGRTESHACKVHPLKKRPMLRNEITQYAADMNLLLAYFHLRDDWADERSTGASQADPPGTGEQPRSGPGQRLLWPGDRGAVRLPSGPLAEHAAADGVLSWKICLFNGRL